MSYRLGCWFAILLAAVVLSGAAAARADAPAAGAVPPELVDAFLQLKTANSDAREKIYALLGEKGDSRLIPALKAYKKGELLLNQVLAADEPYYLAPPSPGAAPAGTLKAGTLVTVVNQADPYSQVVAPPSLNCYLRAAALNQELCIYGERVKVPGHEDPMLPMMDAFTQQPILGSDGNPLFLAKPDLANAIRAPRRLDEKSAVADLIDQLSLLDPDPQARLTSIRGVADTAGQAFLDSQDIATFESDLAACKTSLTAAHLTGPAQQKAIADVLANIDAALAEHPTTLTNAAPSQSTAEKLTSALTAAQGDGLFPAPKIAEGQAPPAGTPATTINELLRIANSYLGDIGKQAGILDKLAKSRRTLETQLAKDPNSQFASAIKQTLFAIDLVQGNADQQKQAIVALGHSGTSQALNLLQKTAEAAHRMGDPAMVAAADDAIARATRYQEFVHIVLNTFYGLSSGSILVLLALGLSIIFGLMGVINMAHGEFMMVGAFTTLVVSEFFKQHLPGSWFDYYPIVAIPMAFLVAGAVGWLVEALVVRHMYGRPLDTLLATWGVSLILIQLVRGHFGDSVHITPPSWMEGQFELAPDLAFARNRVFILAYCAICIATVYLLVNRTKLGLLLRATTQNRDMASALGVATRRVDALTFSFGTALAGLAGVAVPLVDKINPGMGQDYIVQSFLVVVVGGVGKLAGVIWSGFGIGFITKYFEWGFQWFPSMESGATTYAQVLVLVCIVAFLQRRPTGLFPPRGRLADA